MSHWAIGLRLPGATVRQLAAAIDRGQVIRTHLMRPTWHYVSADDIYWLLALTAAQVRQAMKSGTTKPRVLTQPISFTTNRLIEAALRDGAHLTHDELVSVLKNGGIDTGANRPSHIFIHAELEGVICSGATRGGKITYALLERRVPKPTPISEEEALGRLAQRYFTSHAPATLQDFSWWSGLTAGRAAPPPRAGQIRVHLRNHRPAHLLAAQRPGAPASRAPARPPAARLR